jgi:hypothetical protein
MQVGDEQSSAPRPERDPLGHQDKFLSPPGLRFTRGLSGSDDAFTTPGNGPASWSGVDAAGAGDGDAEADSHDALIVASLSCKVSPESSADICSATSGYASGPGRSG